MQTNTKKTDNQEFMGVESQKLRTFLLYALFAVLIVFTLSQKLSYFQDELLSYTLANNNEVVVRMTKLSPRVVGNITGMRLAHGYRYTPASQAFTIMASVPPQGRFNYANVWKNQAEDTHPPLYYTILHTVCSFFPGSFSRWYGGIINIFFALFILFIARKLVKELTDDDKFILGIVSVMFVLSSAILNSTAFLRMYEMTAFWVMLQTYLFIKQTGKPLTNKFCLQIFAVTLAAALTHYYCVFYIAILCCVFGVHLLIDKDIKGTVRFCISQACAGVASLAIFPAMFTHVFKGARGTEFMANAVFFEDYLKRLAAYWKLFNGQLYGRLLPFFVLIAIALIVYTRGKKTESKETETSVPLLLRKYNLVLIPMIVYFLILAKIAPILAEFAYADIKYLYPVFATALVVFMTWLFTVFKRTVDYPKSKYLMAAAAFAVVVASFLCTDWDDFYLYRNYKSRLPIKEMYADTDCVCFYANIIPKYLFELSHYNTVTFFQMNTLNPAGFRKFLAEARPYKIVICLATQGGENTDAILALLNPELQNYSINKLPLGAAPEGATDGDGGAIYHLTRMR